ncbi:ankyrin [Lentinus tigrinus ALCF2SS1-7]|uniref:Ankyrin n=1 Tax=Lentinus tigrinus ALCF2SS1-6 TaxID=1328759 RepID=A0A5C2RWU4_9APHY|nr:ankyrin [Lentinus tigrinus ALCF2SS1-6]RPD70110.1 ankyrin [Lentinus tigrinus ALCF2SS1-7]
MPQTPEAQAFLTRITQLPPGPGVTDLLSQVLQLSLDDEAQLRKLWATDKTNSRLRDPHVGLVDVFDAPDDIRKTRARVVTGETDLVGQYILPLDETRRRKEGEPAMVSSLEEFKKNWGLFTEGSLSQLTDWSNVVAAGGAVQACLAPLPESAKASKRAMRKYYHNNAFPTSDVDLFLYGLTPEQAEVKMQTIYEAVRDSVPWDVTCVRTKHTVSIHSQYPYRSIQIVLRLYSSPAEILAGFDVDAPCCAFDGQRVWANPRAIVAMMRQCNTVDMTRRSPSYEVRLTKYSLRDFEVYVPTLRRDDIDPTIFERSIQRVEGLARLLVLERLADVDARQKYLLDRRSLRGRPDANIDYSRRKKKLKGDLKANIDIGGLEMNDYDVVSLHIPYGPGWDARRIDKLVYQTDLGMNSPFNPKNKDRRLHRHPAFFGTLQECIEDCCEYCPEPKDDEEKKLQEEEDASYVRGRVQFIQEDPGRQSLSGSFNPIDEGEWAEQAYIGPTDKLFNAIVLGDRAAVGKIATQEGFDLNHRDHVGRTPLQLAILSKEVDIACDLIDAGARMTARVVDGRTALHLAAQLDLPKVVRKLLERSAVNAEKAKEEEEAAKRAEEQKKNEDKMDVDDDDGEGEEDDDDDEGDDEDEERDSSDDDWSSEDGDKKDKKGEDTKQDLGQIPEDEEDVPDVFDVNVPDWDYALTPLQYAIIFGSLGAIDELIAGGADATLMTKAEGWWTKPYHPLTLTAVTRDIAVAGEVVKKLVAAGATSSQADDDLFTIFHRVVCSTKPELVDAFLRHDPNAKAVINSPFVSNQLLMTYPIVSALAKNDFATMAVLLAHGAKVTFTEEDFSHARDLRKNAWHSGELRWRQLIHWPVETALYKTSDVLETLLNLGADFNIGMRLAYNSYSNENSRLSLLDAVRGMMTAIKKELSMTISKVEQDNDMEKFEELAEQSGWMGNHWEEVISILRNSEGKRADGAPMVLGHNEETQKKMKKNLNLTLDFLTKAEELLVSRGAKTWKELYPDQPTTDDPSNYFRTGVFRSWRSRNDLEFFRMTGTWGFEQVPSHLTARYNELYDACSDGDNAKIEELCLPKDGKSDQQLIQITSRFAENHYATPLTLAIKHRHWSTARLVLAIAVAQYKPVDAKPPKFKLAKIALEDDSDDEDSDMEDEEEEEPEINFVDIAQRPSSVQCDVAPERLLQLNTSFQHPKTNAVLSGLPLYKAVLENDFEAFVQIADLYKALPKPLDLPNDAKSWILAEDRPDMLDELIRRTGAGIEIPEEESQDDEEQSAEDAKPKKLPPKTYLGLNVHGKKRKDLVKKSDPNAPSNERKHEFPLLWTAAHQGAIGCIRYLSSERAVSAYQYYASTHSDDHAQYLKRIIPQIPARIGWKQDELNESVVTAAIIGDHLDVLKAVVDLEPAQMQDSLMAKILYVGFNNILVAANWGCSPDMFDYLLSKGISPTETDCRGWNVYHILCAQNSEKHMKLLKHILNKLPEDVTCRMLVQQSKKALNTPLHIAVKKHSIVAVKLFLKFKAPVFLLRDRSGSTPLHIATKDTLAEITRLLGEAGPEEALTLEDGVGNTPLEMVVSQWLQVSAGNNGPGTLPLIPTISDSLHPYSNDRPYPSDKDIQKLRETIEHLVAQGRLRNGTKLATELASFTSKIETSAKKRAEAAAAADDNLKDDKDAEFKPLLEDRNCYKTLDYIVEAVASKPHLRRQLVHLNDVHRSVDGTLQRVGRKPNTLVSHGHQADDEGLEPEVAEDKETKAKNFSAVAQWHSTYAFELWNEDTI